MALILLDPWHRVVHKLKDKFCKYSLKYENIHNNLIWNKTLYWNNTLMTENLNFNTNLLTTKNCDYKGSVFEIKMIIEKLKRSFGMDHSSSSHLTGSISI